MFCNELEKHESRANSGAQGKSRPVLPHAAPLLNTTKP
jgi:hypothetical protein